MYLLQHANPVDLILCYSAPTLAEFGEEGTEMWVELELKLVADVGIIGVPNAGKSTLLSVLSNAKPKVADYPFTTLVPNLGVCEMDYRTTVFADIPGAALLGFSHSSLCGLPCCKVLCAGCVMVSASSIRTLAHLTSLYVAPKAMHCDAGCMLQAGTLLSSGNASIARHCS